MPSPVSATTDGGGRTTAAAEHCTTSPPRWPRELLPKYVTATSCPLLGRCTPLAEAGRDGRLAIRDVTDLGPAIFTRGVLLDFVAANPLEKGHPISGEDLDHLARRQEVTLEPGDALVVRAGPTSGAGIAASAVRWMHHHQVSVYLGDVSDLVPPPHHGPLALPLHQIGLARMGLPIVDGAHLDPLAVACANHDRHTFALAMGPLPVHGATGSPVTPLALF